VQGYICIDGNKMADQLDRQGSTYPLIGPKSAIGIPPNIVRGVIRYWTSSKFKGYWQSIFKERHLKGLLNKPSTKRAQEILNLSKNQLRIMTRLLTRQHNLKEHIFKLGLAYSPGCDRSKQEPQMTSHILCYCEPY
jgi:hypothetical protein